MIHQPVATYGACHRCGKEGTLGDGLCRSCWDGDGDEEEHVIKDVTLSVKEINIIRLVSQGFKHREIGERLGMKPANVKYAVYRVADKLGAQNVPQAVSIAKDRKII